MRLAYVCFGVLSPTRAHNVQVTRTVEALAGAGVDVVFVNPRWFEPSGDLGPARGAPDVPSVLIPRTEAFARYRRRWQRGRFWALFADRSIYALRAAAAVRREAVDAIVTRDIVVCAWLHALAPWLRRPVIYEAHGSEQVAFGPVFDRSSAAASSSRTADFSLDQHDDSRRGRLFLALLARVEDWAIRRSAAVIALTDAFAAELMRRLAIAPPHVIPSGHDVSGAAIDRTELRRRLDLPAGQWIALYAGLSFGGKSPAYLLEVAAHLPDHITIVIVGGTPIEHAELRDQAARQGATRVAIRPRVTHDEAIDYVRAADVGLLLYPDHPSLGVHSSPLKAVEYLAAGVPVVATDSPAARELIRHGDNGWLVARDPRAIARCLAAAAASPPAVRAARRDAARRSASGRDYAARGRRIAEVVRRVVASRR